MKKILKLFSITITSICLITSVLSVEAKASRKLYSFSVISDTHVGNEDDNGLKSTSRALNCIKNAFPNDKCIVINGDVVDNYNDASYNWLATCIDRVNNNTLDLTYNSESIAAAKNKKLPYIYFNLGNHETRKIATGSSIPEYYDWSLSQFTTRLRAIQVKLSPASDVSYTPRDQSKPYISQTVAGNKFIFIGSDKVAYRDDCAYIGSDQLNWLEGELSNSNNNLTFLFCHQPPLGDEEHPGIFQSNEINCINSTEEFKKVVGDKKKLIMFTSHEHNKFDAHNFDEGQNYAELGKVHVFSTSSVKKENSEPEGCHVTVYDDKVVVLGVRYNSGNSYTEMCKKVIRY